MSIGEIISIIAVLLSFIGVASSFMFSYKKADKERDQERELNVRNITTIKDDLGHVSTDVKDIRSKIDKIDDKINQDHAAIIEHETKIKNLEHEVFNRGRN